MRNHIGLISAAAMLSGLVTTASAQWQGPPSVLTPELYMWGEAPPFWNDTLIHRAIYMNLYSGGYIHGAFRQFGELSANGPEYAAEYVVKNIIEGEYNNSNVQTQSPIAAGKVCLIIQGIGEESTSYDAPTHTQRAHRWFRPNRTNAWAEVPPKPNGDALNNITEQEESSTGRPYKHPLVINSGLVPVPGAGVNGPYEPSPLFEWMDRFCAEYVLIQENPARVGLPSNTVVPDPGHWYYDAEPIIVEVPSAQSIGMLKKLAQHPRWTGMKLPGDPLGRTAAQAFEDARDDALAQNCVWPTIANLDTTNWLQRGADQDINRDLMSWWYTVVQHSQSAVMDHAVFSRLRAHWPNSWQTMQFGNYDDVSTDGVTDRTGWMQSPPSNFQWLGGGGPNQCVERSEANDHRVTQFPRVNLSKHRGSSFVPVYTGSPNPAVWLGIESRASGTVDQPLLYPVGGYGYDGDCYMEVPGNKQIEQYDPLRITGTRPWETDWESSMRVGRHLIESSIHSTVGSRVGNENNIVPWALMAGTNAEGEASLENFQMRGRVREQSAMLRAKRLTGVAYWTPWNRASLSEIEKPIDVLWSAWADTQDCVRRVYANRLNKYTRTFHNQFTTYAPYDVDRLEYTLSNDETLTNGSKVRAEVAIKSKGIVQPFPGPGTPPVQMTEMVVDYEYVDPWPLASMDNGQDSVYLDLRVECSTSVAGVRGMIFVYDWADTSGNPWRQVDTYDTYDPNTGASNYLCHTDVVDGRYENRRRFEIQTYEFFTHPETFRPGWYGPDPTDGNKLKTRVKYVHLSSVSFWSWYDLTQVIASPTADPTSGQLSGASTSMARSDVNYDGVVDESDFATYFEEWIHGQASADLNADSAVENDDLGTFVEAYTTGT